MACCVPIPHCCSRVMLFGPSLYQLALLCCVETPGLNTGPRLDREHLLKKPHMPNLATHWSPAWM
jgi:hypothetical protein